MTKKIIIVILLINVYFIINLFIGNNNISKYFFYKKETNKLKNEQYNLVKERYKLKQLSFFLSNENKDSNDALDELLRQLTQSSLPEEKIVILNNDNN